MLLLFEIPPHDIPEIRKSKSTRLGEKQRIAIPLLSISGSYDPQNQRAEKFGGVLEEDFSTGCLHIFHIRQVGSWIGQTYQQYQC